MATPYTLKKLTDVEDSAANRHRRDPASAIRQPRPSGRAHGPEPPSNQPGKRQGFGHRHVAAEEVYVVLAGSGRVKLDDEIVAIEPLDAIRVAPGVTRAFEAGPEGIEVLALGPRHEGDGEVIQNWWTD